MPSREKAPDEDAATEVTGRGESRRRLLWDSLAVAVGFATIGPLELYVAAQGGTETPSFVDWLLLPWVPMGIATAVLLLRGANRWPGVVAGSLGYGAIVGAAPMQIVVGAATNTLAALAICMLLHAWRFNPAIERWRDPFLLWAAAAIGALGDVCAQAGGFLASAWLDPTHLYPSYARITLDAAGHLVLSVPLLQLGLRWWLNYMAGVALVVPCIYAFSHAGSGRLGTRLPELLAIVLFLVGWIIAAFAPLPWAGRLPLALAGLLLVTWAAIRFGAGLTAFVTLALALATSVAYMLGRGPLHARPDDALASAWSFIIMIALLGQLITSLLAERDAAARRQAASEAQYRALFDSNPQPLWVQDAQSQRILIVNDAAVRQYGYAREEFTSLYGSDLAARDRPGSAQGAAEAILPDGYEQLHRTRDGALITVELRTQPVDLDGRKATLVFSQDVTERNHLRSAIIGAADRAARQLGQEMHDGLGQELVGLSLLTRALCARAKRGVSADAEISDRIDGIAQRAVSACRNIAHGLSALAETHGDLAAALRRLPARYVGEGMPRVSVDIDEAAASALADAARDHVYRICQEALTNVVKHARAQRVDLRLTAAAGCVILIIRDDGLGLPRTADLNAGLGFSSMRHRAAAIGARLDVTCPNGGGTEIRVVWREAPPARASEHVRPRDEGT